VTISGDVDGSVDVSIMGVAKTKSIHTSGVGDPRFNANKDMNNDGKITILDVAICSS
jgi:hypothetical protein